MQISNDVMQWNINFIILVHKWEVESITLFFEMLYCHRLRRGGEDKICWPSSKKHVFEVISYYHTLSPPTGPSFPWKTMWRNKASSRVAFVVWATVLEKILTLDNLRKRHIILLD